MTAPIHKHVYAAIRAIIRARAAAEDPDQGWEARCAVRAVAHDLADYFEALDPDFDRKSFLIGI